FICILNCTRVQKCALAILGQLNRSIPGWDQDWSRCFPNRVSALGRTGWCERIDIRLVRFMVMANHCTAAYCSCVRSPEDINWAAWSDSMSSMVVTVSASKGAARSWAVYDCSASHHAESVPRRWSDTPALTA